MKFRTIQEIPLKGKRVLIRVDFNVPINEIGQIMDDSRIIQALPTIKFVVDQGGSAILMSHLGNPGGRRVAELSLAPVAKRLSEFLNKNVAMAPDCIGQPVEKMIAKLMPGEILLLENLRFHIGEEKPEENPDFVDKLSRLSDIYINDAFGSAHRKHASTYYIAEKIPIVAAGFLIEKEVLVLSNLLTQAQSPVYAIIGGSKISSKIGALESLLNKIDGLLIGGAMVFTFMKALNIPVGNSLVDDAHIDTAKQLMKKCRAKNIDFHLPVDIVITDSLSCNAHTSVALVSDGIEGGWIGADIGQQTVEEWSKFLKKANTIFWNGPLGVFELEQFSHGTEEIAKIIANSYAMSIVGGGDSVAAINKLKLSQKFTHISTGGGATLEFIEHGTLSALKLLSKK